MSVDAGQIAALALKWADEASALLMEARDGVRHVDTKSSMTDVVTDMDRASEQLLVQRILTARPHDGILGEEGADRQGRSGVRWVIDPLDGTVNYLYGLPNWAVSVGVEVDGVAIAGAVAAPAIGESYVGWRDGGAWRLRGGVQTRLTVSAETRLSQSLIGTGFSYDAGIRREQGVMVAALLPDVRDIRRAGSAAIDLCTVASGALDGYVERGLNPWDLRAGEVIAREAGATLSGVHGRCIAEPYVVAAAPGIHAALLRAVEDSVGS